MFWPDHLLMDDDRLASAVEVAHVWRPGVRVRSVLRHVQGRRVTALAECDDRPVVVKLFSSPRARGNHRRLDALAAAGVGDLVPRSLGHDPTGHVGMIEYRHGSVFDQLPDDEFLAAAELAGAALRRLHDCGAELDRHWTVDDEIDALCRRATDHTRPFVDTMLDGMSMNHPGPLVPSHRDCHPRQLVAAGRQVHWIDLDDCTMAPAGLDVGNMAAHLSREGIIGRRPVDVAEGARDRFIAGYGWTGPRADLDTWELLSLARLAGLAETRHGAPDERDALLDHAATVPA